MKPKRAQLKASKSKCHNLRIKVNNKTKNRARVNKKNKKAQ